MTQFEKLTNMNLEDLAEWLDKYGQFEDTPWLRRFDRLYCKNCASVMVRYEDSQYEFPCAWCEINGKCKHFPEIDGIPGNKDMIKMWLKSSVGD